jgi:hypothetical protein
MHDHKNEGKKKWRYQKQSHGAVVMGTELAHAMEF